MSDPSNTQNNAAAGPSRPSAPSGPAGPRRPAPGTAGPRRPGLASAASGGGATPVGAALRAPVQPGASSSAAGGAGLGPDGKPKMVFRPSMPSRKVKSEAPDVKPETSLLAQHTRGRGRGRGSAPRGRGGRGGGSGAEDRKPEMIASGPFAQGPSANRPRGRPAASAAFADFAPSAPQIALKADRKPVYTAQGEEYSDEETQGGQVQIIDMELVPEELGESAPTGLIRDRSMLDGQAKDAKAKGRVKGKGKISKPKMEVRSGEGAHIVKAEEPGDEVVVPGTTAARRKEREDDTMLSEDEDVDVDMDGVRVGEDTPEVNVTQAVDMSDSEIEEEEEDMTGDFVKEPGMDDPDDKLYLFQFPNPFPHFVPNPELSLLRDFDEHYPPASAPAKKEPPTSPDKPHGILKKVQFGGDVKVEDKDEKKEAKRVAKEQEERKAMLKELQKQEAERKPEGRIGTLVVMKSGKVKMVLGKDIVMDVSAGVPTTFVQQVVHLDPSKRRAAVLGEVHKSYVMLPDINRLLGELRELGGVVPGENDDGVKLEKM